MTNDVRIALDRFQNFTGRFSHEGVIDEASGFTTGDAALLIGEVELADAQRRVDEHFHDDDA